MGKELPKNWVETSLGKILKLKNGYAFKSKDYREDGIPLIRISNIQQGIVSTEKSIYVDKNDSVEDFIIEKRDILIAMSGATTGKYGVYQENRIAYQNQRVGNLKPHVPSLTSRSFILYLLGGLKKEIEDKAYGGAQPNISPKLIENIKIGLPPLPEQTRIVAKLDQLFGQLAQINASLDKIPQLLKDFRQQILTQAVTGKLTIASNAGQWSVEPIKKLTTKVGSGSTPRGGNAAYKEKGIPLIRSMNVHFNGIKFKGLAFIDNQQAEKLKNVEVYEDDVLLNITGASIGRVCLAPKEMRGARVNQHVSILRVNKKILPRFLSYYLASSTIQDFIFNENYGTTRQALTKTQILNLEIPFPSIEKQKNIVIQIETLFAKADAIEQQYQTLKQKIDTLPQAILHKAFKGELVEQLEIDGDARELLEEIKRLRKQSVKPNVRVSGSAERSLSTAEALDRTKGKKKPKEYKVEDGELGRVADGN